MSQMSQTQMLMPHLRRLHQNLEDATSDLTPHQLHWRPGKGCTHIAFSLWHYVRTEDNLIRFVLQNRRTTVWLEKGWNEVFHLDRVAQGTGMSLEDASAIRIPSSEEFLPYMRDVWLATEEYVGSITEDGLREVFRFRPMGERTALEVLMENLLTHGFSHLGEIWVLRALQGLEGSPI